MSVQNTNLNPTTQTGADAAVQGANRSRRSQETQSAHRVSSGSGAAAARATDSSGDNVQLSGVAQHIQTLKATLSTDSPEHQARVDALAKSYAAGTYTPDPHGTAVGIVSDAVDNHGRK